MPIAVIIPAYNEEAGIGRVLDGLLHAPESGPDIEVVVAPNGCTDRTAEVAREHGARVVALTTPSKTAAINAADAVAMGYPRVYLDADIAATPELIRALAAAVSEPGAAAAVPRPEIDLSGCSLAVRGYYAINARLPVFEGRLFGRGVIALSEEGRRRFERFPELIADDMFLDAVVTGAEKRQIDLPVRVRAPRRVGDLIRRVARAREGNVQFWRWVQDEGPRYGAAADPVRGARRLSWLRDVVLRAPYLLPAAICYAAVVLLAERKRRSRRWNVQAGWGRPTPGTAAS
jgi:glycosyltransferase involved in cell wall biosynthesis